MLDTTKKKQGQWTANIHHQQIRRGETRKKSVEMEQKERNNNNK